MKSCVYQFKINIGGDVVLNVDIKTNLKDMANKLPLKPGVYLMKNTKGDVIYVGKAKSLKNRVTQYFGHSTNHSAKVIKMVSNVNSFETIICDTEYEALMLENSLIKQHQPKYNILLKDDKGFHYVKVTNETWPKIEAVKTIKNDGAEYIGPYYSFSVVRQTVDEALKVFKLPNCNRSFDKPTKPCLNYHIGTCYAPCKNNSDLTDYRNTVKSAVDYIKKGGYNDADIALLKDAMQEASDNLNFEVAAKLRDRIIAIEKSKERQKVILSTYEREDIIATAIVGEVACVTVFVFRNGHLSDQKQFFLEGAKTKGEYYAEFLQQFYLKNDIPPHIAIDYRFYELELIQQWLSDIKGSKVQIVVPQKGTQHKLISMCLSNSSQALSLKLERNDKEMSALSELAELLGLKSVPKRIEAYDISNTAGSNNVGAMVVFINGRPDKKLYRKFKIKSFIGQDDFRSLSEIIERRIKEYFSGEDESFKNLPDLILLDGGKGQLSAVKSVLTKYKLDSFVNVFGMVKDSKHKTKAITAGDEDIQIKANRKAFTFVTQVQDEVHRFAISYHHKSNKLSTLQLELTKIDGIGEITAKKLIRSFKSLKKIKSASLVEFKENGFSEKIASKVINYFNENN